MENFYDLQDREFRELLCHNLTLFYPEIYQDALFKKEKIDNNDVLKLHFKLIKYNSVNIEYVIAMSVFDYKMRKINDEQAAKFSAIVKEKTGFTHPNNKMTWDDLHAVTCSSIETIYLLGKLVDIFLDEIK